MFDTSAMAASPSTSSPAGSPAREPQRPGSATGSIMPRPFCGARCDAPFASYSPDTSWSRTSPTFSLSGELGNTTDAYAAGLIDGEGCIYLRPKRRSFTAHVDVGMSQKAVPVLRVLHAEYGGTLRQDRDATDRHAARWRWTLAGQSAEATLRRLLPFLLLKTEQARLVLKAAERRDATVTPRQWWPADLTAEVTEIATRIKAMNRTGPTTEPVLPAGGMWLRAQATLEEPCGERFSGTWPRSGTTSSGIAYRQEPSAPLTAVTGSSPLLPTPTAGEAKQARNKTSGRREGSEHHSGTTLTDVAYEWSGATTSPPSADGKPSTDPPQLRLYSGFVEWMIGAPPGWSDPDCPLSATEFNARSAGSPASTS
jgi:hypothetical protein